MGDLIAELFISLDGYAYGEGAPAYFGYLGPDLERRIDENVAAPQVMLMGRKTYKMMSDIVRDQPVEGADRMNELPKIVFSRTLEEPLGWNDSRLAKADLVEEVRSLKAKGGDPLRTIGRLSVVKALVRAGLVDRLRLIGSRRSSAKRDGNRSSPISRTSIWNWWKPASWTVASSRSSTAR